MATSRGARELERMQQSADMQMDVLILNRVMGLPDSHPNGLVVKVKQYAKDLAWDGTRGMALYEKTATAMMSDGFGSPRDAFPEVYGDVLEQRDALLRENQEQLDRLEAKKEERHAWAVGQQYQEVDAGIKAGSLGEEGIMHLSEQQAAADQRMGEVVKRLAKRAMDKIADTMVAFDNSIDAVAAKSKSMWSSVTDAMKSRKTKVAALAATAIVAAGLTGGPAKAADVPQDDIPTTHAEMMQSMHEGRMEQMEQDIQGELQVSMHEARADYMEQQLRQEAKDRFSSHLQSLKAEAVAEFSEGLDQAIEKAEDDFDYSYNILHNPVFQDAALSNPDVQDALMSNEDARDSVRHSLATQNLMDDMQYDDGIMAKLLDDEVIQQRVTELESYKRMMQQRMDMGDNSLDDNALMSRTIEMPGVKDMVLQDGLVKLEMMVDQQIQDRVLDEPVVREMAFSAPETKERLLGVPGIDRVLNTPEMEGRVMQNFDDEVSLNIPEEGSQAPRLNITQSELDNLSAPSSERSPKLDLPSQQVHRLDVPEQKERNLVNLQPAVERKFNADLSNRMESDTISYGDLSQLALGSGAYLSVDITPPPTSNMEAEIDANSIKFLVEREGVDFSQYMGEIEANGSADLVSTMKRLVESAGMTWDVSGYDQKNDPNHFVVGKSSDVDASIEDREEYSMTSPRG